MGTWMSEPEENDLDALPEGELLTLPDGAIPPGWLREFFARRAALIHQQESNELALELSGWRPSAERAEKDACGNLPANPPGLVFRFHNSLQANPLDG